MLWSIGAYWVALAYAIEPSERTLSARAALIGAATFALTRDIASRSGSAAADSLSTSCLESWRRSNSPRPSWAPQSVQVLVTSILECSCSLPMAASFTPGFARCRASRTCLCIPHARCHETKLCRSGREGSDGRRYLDDDTTFRPDASTSSLSGRALASSPRRTAVLCATACSSEGAPRCLRSRGCAPAFLQCALLAAWAAAVGHGDHAARA